MVRVGTGPTLEDPRQEGPSGVSGRSLVESEGHLFRTLSTIHWLFLLLFASTLNGVPPLHDHSLTDRQHGLRLRFGFRGALFGPLPGTLGTDEGSSSAQFFTYFSGFLASRLGCRIHFLCQDEGL